MKRHYLLVILILSFVVEAQAQDKPKSDTIDIGGVTVIRDNEMPPDQQPERKGIFKKLGTMITPRRFKTEWGNIDAGFSNFVDNTNYQSAEAKAYAPGINREWMEIKPFKSRNVNIWIITQRVSLADHVVNFQYGLGIELNNYFYKQPVIYSATTPAVTNPPVMHLDTTPGRTYKKDKLAADYLTVPLMLNFNFTPYRLYPFEISAGVSAGYLYSARNKTVSSDEGKKTSRDDFDLRPWKLSYIGEVSLGVVSFYGSYAFKSMYKRGLDLTPYNFGIRIKAAEVFAKMESE